MANFNRKTRIIEENMIFPPKKNVVKKKVLPKLFPQKTLLVNFIIISIDFP